MVPVLLTATVMFSGFVVVGMLTAFGRSTFTVRVMTGIVMRNIMSSTSMTSTSGVVLIVAIMDGPSPDGEPTFIDIGAFLFGLRCPSAPAGALLAQRRRRRRRRARAAHVVAADASAADEVGVQIGGKVAQGVLQGLVAAQEPVVTHDR